MFVFNKMAVTQSLSFDDARFEMLFVYLKYFRYKGKTKEMVKFIVKENGCSWNASNWVWTKPDLPTF